MGGKKPLRRPLWPPTRATASNYYPLGLDGAGGAAKPLLRAPKKPAPLHGRLPAFSGAVDAFERARKCFLEWRYFFSIILSEFLKNRVALQPPGFPENGRLFCRKVVLCPGKSTGRLLRPFIPPFLTDFTMFFAKKALQMNFKNILYNYRFNFFTQIVSYRFVWGSRVCAFCTASALR